MSIIQSPFKYSHLNDIGLILAQVRRIRKIRQHCPRLCDRQSLGFFYGHAQRQGLSPGQGRNAGEQFPAHSRDRGCRGSRHPEGGPVRATLRPPDTPRRPQDATPHHRNPRKTIPTTTNEQRRTNKNL